MDGLKRKIAGSIQAQLSLWISTVVVLAAVGGGYFSLSWVFHEVNELQDDQLRQVAGLMMQQQPAVGQVLTHATGPANDPESQIIVQVLGPDERTIRLLDEETVLPEPLSDGIQILTGRRYTWRVVVGRLPNSAVLVVSQRTDVRDELARSSAWRTVFPLVALIPVLLLLLNIIIRRMFRSVRSLALELDGRAEGDLRALDDRHVPTEIRPFTTSINGLLRRVRGAMDMQRRFVADAAHELRTPLTALSLQADNIRKADLSPEAVSRFAELRRGLVRMRSLLEQLLAMARSQESPSHPTTRAPMEQIFKQVLEDLMPAAEAKHIEVDVATEPDAVFEGQLFDALTLLKNIVDNAIRYSAPAGQISLRASRDGNDLVITVADSGPGIPETEQGRVFDPFYRILGGTEPGSGLGLAIVKAIADRNHGHVYFRNRPGGLLVTIRLPAPDANGDRSRR